MAAMYWQYHSYSSYIGWLCFGGIAMAAELWQLCYSGYAMAAMHWHLCIGCTIDIGNYAMAAALLWQ